MSKISINRNWVLIGLPIFTLIIIVISIYFYANGIANSYKQEDLLVTNLTANSATIVLRTDKVADVQLAYNSDQVELNSFNVLLNKFEIGRSALNGAVDIDSKLHYFEVTGLNPNTSYKFGFLKGKVFLTPSPINSYSFTTLPLSEQLDIPNPIYGKIEGLSADEKAVITMELLSKESAEVRSSRASALISQTSTYTIDSSLFIDNITGKIYSQEELKNFNIKAQIYSEQNKYPGVILNTDKLKPAGTIKVSNDSVSMFRSSLIKQLAAESTPGKWLPVCVKTGEHAPAVGGKVQIDEQVQYTFYYQYAANDNRDYNADGKKTWRDVCLKWSNEVCKVFNDKPNLLASCNDKSIPDSLPEDFQQRIDDTAGSATTSEPNEAQENPVDSTEANVTDIASGDNGIVDVPFGGASDSNNSSNDNTLAGVTDMSSMWNSVYSDNSELGSTISNVNFKTQDFGGNAACITYKADGNTPPGVTVKCKQFASVQKDEYILLSHELTHSIQYRCSNPNLPQLQQALDRIRELTAETNGMRLGMQKRGIDPVSAGYGNGNGYYYFNYSYGDKIVEGYAKQVEPKLSNLVIGTKCKNKGVDLTQIGFCTSAAMNCMADEYKSDAKNSTLQHIIDTRVTYQLLAAYPGLEKQNNGLPKSYKIYAEAPASQNLAQESGTYNVFFDGQLIGTQEIILGDNQNLLTIKVFKDTNNNRKKDADEEYLPSSAVQLQKQNSIFKYKLNIGWNLINIPLVTNQGELTAKDLIAIWKEDGVLIEKISTFDSGKFTTYSDRSDGYGENFDIELGQGVFVFTREAKTAILTGQVPEEDIPVVLNNGWNLVGPVKEGKTSQTVINNLKKQAINADTISSFENGRYDSYVVDKGTAFGTEYVLQPNKGYFIKVNSGGSTTGVL